MLIIFLSGFVIKGERMVVKEVSKLLRIFFCKYRNYENVFREERACLNMEGRGRKKYNRKKEIDRIRFFKEVRGDGVSRVGN